ncbi:MAG: hypothetical protein ACFFFH_17825, partial [Candidatus Thorarchaeota archaeon]
MLIRFLILNQTGSEIFAYTPENIDLPIDNPQLINEFMSAVQFFAEGIERTFQKITFSNLFLYIQTYGNFTLQMLLDEKKADNEIKTYFDQIAKRVISLFAEKPSEDSLFELFENRLLPIISPPSKSSLVGMELEQASASEPGLKIALVGLAKAGKTTLRNMFFDK